MANSKVSFEFFPQKTEESLQKLTKTAKDLSTFNPEYFSMTYGAGGSTQNNTLNAIEALIKDGHQSIAPHISCIGSSKETIKEMLGQYQAAGLDRLVVLRGDLPSGYGSYNGDFHYARDLVTFIREHTNDHFHIEVAVYPESHPEAKDLQTDLKHFKEKVDAGANAAITQYFYNADAYYHLLDQCAKLNIDIPIVPGIMPITNFQQLARFSDTCGAEIPRWIRKTLEGYGDDLDAIKKFGAEVVSRLCEQLLELGAPSLHFYTLNKSEASKAILKNLNQA